MAEDMEIDHIVDVPDTPERITTVRCDDQNYLGNPEKTGKALNVAGEMNNQSNYITLSPLEESYPSQNALIFRKAQTDQIIGVGATHCNGAEKVQKGKNMCSKSPKLSYRWPISDLDLSEESGQYQQQKPAFSRCGSRDIATEDRKALKASMGNPSLPVVTDSSNIFRNSFTGKCKHDNKTLPGPNTSVDRGKSIVLSNDPQSQSEKKVSLPLRDSTTPQGRGPKRLVRNGCISPVNIATREKQLAEQSNHQTKDVEQSHAGHLVSNNSMSSITVDDMVAEERGSGRVKGKGVLIRPSSPGLNAVTFHTTSSPLINYEEVNGTSNAMRNSLQYTRGQDGWRTTHNERNADGHLHDVNGHHSRRNNDVGRVIIRQNANRMDRRNTGSGQSSKHIHSSLSDHTTQPTNMIIPDGNQSSEICPTADILTKRQRKRESPLGNPPEVFYNSEVMFLSSSGESSSSSRIPVLDSEVVDLSTPRESSSFQCPVFDHEVIELLSTPKYANRSSEDFDDNDNNSEARARQVEADEILARELQEQLYHDDSFEGRGIDEQLAWEMQRGEDLVHTSIGSRRSIYHPAGLLGANRQPHRRSHQNSSRRRAQVPLTNRMSQWRSRVTSRTRSQSVSSRGRGPRFPLDMDLDMRLDILEALEDSMGGFGDMGMADGIFNGRHDFNEDDYEMLLALDEGNHQHTGASANLINSLPQSTIQTDNFTEACAICLEIPERGDTIRHLPCLHKFHKDCIDPWLRRKTSCPVCKSSIS